MNIRDKRIKTGLLSFLTGNINKGIVVEYTLNNKEYIKVLSRATVNINTVFSEVELVFQETYYPVDIDEYELVYPDIKAHTNTKDGDYIFLYLKLYKKTSLNKNSLN